MLAALWLVTAALAAEDTALTGEDDECPVVDADYCPVSADDLSTTEWLRAVSLDLRGVIPTIEELDAVDSGARDPEDYLDEWLESPAFAERAVRIHRKYLWNNLSGLTHGLNALNTFIRPSNTGVWSRTAHPSRESGRDDCTDRPATPTNLDGWVLVRPYWAPTTEIRVCAPEASARLVSPRGIPCDSQHGLGDVDCGCGPALQWCQPPGWRQTVVDAFGAEIDQRVRSVIQEDKPYTELLNGRTMWVNGPIVHYLRHQRWTGPSVSLNLFPVDGDALPDLAPTDTTTWRPVTLGVEQSGVFTSAAYLLRFNTQRARAKRFFEAFLCSPFVPPPAGIVAGTSTSVDLARRDGCAYCHIPLEPAAAAWARWVPLGAGYLDPDEYPIVSEECRSCAYFGDCSYECASNYLVRPVSAEQNPYVGMLDALQFRPTSDYVFAESGPRELVRRGMADGRIPQCVVANAAHEFLGRSLVTEAETEGEISDIAFREDLLGELLSSGWSYRALVRALLTSGEYRRVE